MPPHCPAVENIRFTLEAMAALSTSRSVFFEDGGFAFAAGADAASMNWAFFPSPHIDGKTVTRVCSFFDELSLPFLWPVFPETRYRGILEEAGMRLLGERLVMACSNFPLEADNASDFLTAGSFTFEINQDPGAWAETAAMAFGFSPGAPASLVNLARGLRGNENFYLVLAKKDGVPAGTAMLVLDDRVKRVKNAGIYYFATLPSERNKGVGDATLRKTFSLASGQGCNIITLQATPSGALFYGTRGFEPLFRLPFYSLPRTQGCGNL